MLGFGFGPQRIRSRALPDLLGDRPCLIGCGPTLPGSPPARVAAMAPSRPAGGPRRPSERQRSAPRFSWSADARAEHRTICGLPSSSAPPRRPACTAYSSCLPARPNARVPDTRSGDVQRPVPALHRRLRCPGAQRHRGGRQFAALRHAKARNNGEPALKALAIQEE